MYGLMLLAGDRRVRRASPGVRWVARGGDWDLIFRVAVWGVGAGIVGARLYHVVTSWNEVPGRVVGAVRGLGGRARGLGRDRLGGVVVGAIVAKRSGASVAALARRRRARRCSSRRRSAASATGGTRSSSASRPTCRGGSRSTPRTGRTSTSLDETFHPTFLYEALWDLGAAGAPAAARPPLPHPAAGALRALRRALHRFGASSIELLRIDPSHEIARAAR